MQIDKSPDSVIVTGLFSYPVKGGRGVSHTNASVLTTGLTHDREWMVVDARTSPAQFLTQRDCAAMAKLDVEVHTDGGLMLSFDSGVVAHLAVALPPRSSLIKVKVWGHETVALDAGDVAATWLQRALGFSHPVRLVRFNPDMRLDCNRLYAGNSGAHTYFADGYPLLVANAASLADLNARMARSGGVADGVDVAGGAGIGGNALPMNRFRPNVVIEGVPAWDEDHIDTIGIGSEVVLRLVKPCVRCEVTTIDQTTGLSASDEPLDALARFRSSAQFGGVTFGWNAVVVTPGSLSIGDQARVTYRF